ncbi:MAG: hypothetical protein M3N53_06340 [Actinomycetota bacterium]|nr:hypothetical protein [Actinomycetota bacterium]
MSMQSDGSGRSPLTGGSLSDAGPALSPDRRKLLFTKTSGATFDGDVYKMNVDGTIVVRLTRSRSGAGGGDWAPGMKRLVFLKLFEGGDTAGIDIDLYIMKANGDDKRRLTRNNVVDYQPVWGPDGRIVFSRARRNGTYDLMSIRPDGSGLRRLTDTGADEYGADISPDGERIVFVRRAWEGTTERIMVMNSDGTEETTLLTSEFGFSSPRWSADGDEIVFIGGFQIYRMNADGSGLVQVTNGSAEYFSLDW